MRSSTRRAAALASSYEDFHLLVFYITHSFATRFDIPFDDLISEAHVAFVKAFDSYDPSHGTKVSSWIYHEVWTGLMSFMRKELRHRNLEELTDQTPMGFTTQSTFLLDLQDDLGRDARALMEILLSGPRDFSTLCRWNQVTTRTGALEALREYLEDRGWPTRSISRGISDLRALVNNRPKRPCERTDEDEFWDDGRWSAREECWLIDKVGLTPARVQALLA